MTKDGNVFKLKVKCQCCCLLRQGGTQTHGGKQTKLNKNQTSRTCWHGKRESSVIPSFCCRVLQMLDLSRSLFRAVHLFMMTSLQGLTLNSASYWMRSLQVCSRLSCSCCILEHTCSVMHHFRTLLKIKKERKKVVEKQCW